MSIFVNNVEIPNGGELYIDGVKPVDGVYVDGIQVWQNTVVPSSITDFAASDDQLDQVTVIFTPATGIPTPTHDLYDGDTSVAQGIVSGYVHPVTGPYTGQYKVRAVNSAGTADSNIDQGVSLFDNNWDSSPSSVLFTPGDTDVPADTVGIVFSSNTMFIKAGPIIDATGVVLDANGVFSGISQASWNTSTLTGSYTNMALEGDANGLKIGWSRTTGPADTSPNSAYLPFNTATGFDVITVSSDPFNNGDIMSLTGLGFALQFSINMPEAVGAGAAVSL